MSERVTPGPISCNASIKEAVCVNTSKVYDACRSKECIQDLRVYLTQWSQAILDTAVSVKGRKAELLWVYIDVESVPFNKGFYSVDLKYFYTITAEAVCGIGMPKEICGFATFNKRCILFGSEGNAKIFSSQYVADDFDPQMCKRTNLPKAIVEVVDPLILDAKICKKHPNNNCCFCGCDVPKGIAQAFDDELCMRDDGKKLYVTLGQFSIVRLERDIQLLMPAYDICLPTKECSSTNPSSGDPCEIFEQFSFPIEEFFPPKCEKLNCDKPEVCRDRNDDDDCECGCGCVPRPTPRESARNRGFCAR